MAYTVNSAPSELIAGPNCYTLIIFRRVTGLLLLTPGKSESGVKVERKLPNITNSGPLFDR